MSTSRAPLNGNASIAQRVQRYLLVDLEKNLVTICYIIICYIISQSAIYQVGHIILSVDG